MPPLSRLVVLVVAVALGAPVPAAQAAPDPSASSGPVVQAPSSLDATGRTDVTDGVNAFLRSVPDGATAAFPAGARYRLDGTVELRDRADLVVDGRGAVFRQPAGGPPTRAAWRVVGGTRLVLRDLEVVGGNPYGGTPDAYDDDLQYQHGIDLRGVDGVRVERVRVRDVHGDCFYLGLGLDGRRAWSQGVRITDSSCLRNGRQGVAVVAARDVRVEGSRFADIGLMAFDVEPNSETDGGQDVVLTRNTIGRVPRQQVLGIVGPGRVDGITLSDNVLVGQPLTVHVPDEQVWRSRLVITGNTSDTGLYLAGYAALEVARVHGLVVEGNTQPLTGPRMALADVASSCAVRVAGNSAPGAVAELRMTSPACPPVAPALTRSAACGEVPGPKRRAWLVRCPPRR